MRFQLHLARYLMIGAYLQHLFSTHEDATHVARLVLQNLDFASAAFLHLLRCRVEAVEFGTFAEENILILFASFHFDCSQSDDGFERDIGLIGFIVAAAFAIIIVVIVACCRGICRVCTEHQ